MKKAEGVRILTLEFGPEQCTRTFKCLHCGGTRDAVPELQHWCSDCDGMVCADRVCANECKPFQRKLDAAEARDRLYRSVRG